MSRNRAPNPLCIALLLSVVGCTANPRPTSASSGAPPVEASLRAPPPLETLQRDFGDAEAPEARPRSGPPPDRPISPQLDFGRCLRSRLCELEGLCTSLDSGKCIASSDDDCRASEACGGGRCTAREGRCVASNDADCRSSLACSLHGACAFDGDEMCHAVSRADCQASTRCRDFGECALTDGACTKP
ncbi:MAG: hypothetical protein AAGA56_28450 [Myxococcota bacterium]